MKIIMSLCMGLNALLEKKWVLNRLNFPVKYHLPLYVNQNQGT